MLHPLHSIKLLLGIPQRNAPVFCPAGSEASRISTTRHRRLAFVRCWTQLAQLALGFCSSKEGVPCHLPPNSTN